MNIFDRIGFGLSVLFGGEKALIATRLKGWDNGQPAYQETNFQTLATQGYRKNELIFACITKTANAASQVALRVYDKKTEQELPDHPLRELIQSPNSEMAEYDFWSANVVYEDLAGVAYWEKERSAAGRVVGLWPLRPDWLSPVKSSTEFISYYVYEIPGSNNKIPIPKEDVLTFKKFDPLNSYRGWPPAAVAARIGDVDNSTTDFIKMFWERGGMPAGILSTKQHLQDAQVKNIRRRWKDRYGGYKKWLSPAVLDADATYQKTGSSFSEMGFETLDERNEARICMVFGVPPILINAAVGLKRSTYSNYAEARKAWWQDTVSTIFQHYDDTMNSKLVPDFGDNIYLKWDFSKVAAYQEEAESLWNRYLLALGAGGITVNEFREGINLPRLSNGDVLVRTLNQFEIPVREEGAGRKSIEGFIEILEQKLLGDGDRVNDDNEFEKKLTTFLRKQKNRVIDEVEEEALKG